MLIFLQLNEHGPVFALAVAYNGLEVVPRGGARVFGINGRFLRFGLQADDRFAQDDRQRDLGDLLVVHQIFEGVVV